MDFELGTDIVLFGDLSRVSAEHAIPASRNHDEPNPNTDPPGQICMMVKYPILGGFVPWGAKRPDGSPHPHAGTGFGVLEALAWARGAKSSISFAAAHGGAKGNYEYLEVQQHSYDGKSFRVMSTVRIFRHELMPGWTISHFAITNAIPGGDDLLLAMAGRVGAFRFGGKNAIGVSRGMVAGVTRWKRTEKGWRPVKFVPVTGPDGSMEPSLIRDVDGALLFTARRPYDIRVWRSQDGGEAWKLVIDFRGAVASAPITINQAADGSPYIAANVYEVVLHPIAERFRGVYDSLPGKPRENLCLWPLNKERTGLEPPILVRDAQAEFASPSSGFQWNIDHPSSKTLQLADGKWHNVLAMRICDTGEVCCATAPAPQDGAYLEEVFSAGEPVPAWNF